MSDRTNDAARAGRRYEPVPTVCPSCSVGCGLRYSERTGGAVGRDGGPANPEGRLCPKGIDAFDAGDPGDRLTRPRVREGSELVPVEWDVAMERVETEVRAIVDARGPDALAFLGAPRCTNEENYLFAKLARALGTNNVDNRARICHRSTVTAMRDRLGSAGTTNALADLTEADVFLVVGSNPAVQQPVAFDARVRPAVADGATLVHVDPRENQTTRTADVHLAPRPGTDALLVNLVLAELVDAGHVDRRFVRERTTGFPALAASLADLAAGSHSERVGVDATRIRRVADLVGESDRTAVLVGTGAEPEDHRGTRTADALLNLLLVTGNVGRRGTGMLPLRGLNNEQGAADAGARPTTLPGYESLGDSEARERIADEWGVEPPAEPGLSELDAVRSFGDEVAGAYVLGENPAVSRMETQFVARNLEALDFLLVQDVAPSETVAHADVVLPGNTWTEKGGTVTNLDRQVQRMRPAASPPGDARRDLDVVRELGRRLTDASFGAARPEAVFAELTRANPLYAGMSYEGIGTDSQRWPFPEGAEEGVEVLHRDRFRTGDVRAPLVPVDREAEPAGADDGLTLLTRTRVNEATGSASRESGPSDGGLLVHPADAEPRDLSDGESIVVERGDERVRTVARVSRRVRSGAVFLDADRADRLLSGSGPTVVRVASSDAP